MKNFRKLSALILSALASFTLLVGCSAAPVEDTTPAESAPVVPVVEKTAPETTPEATPEETPAPQSDTTEENTESLREFRFTTGLGGANGVAILLPLTFSMPPTSAIIMLSCIYWGALFGGAITSILVNVPGEASSVMSTSRGLEPCASPTMPAICSWSISRPARLYPMENRR